MSIILFSKSYYSIEIFVVLFLSNSINPIFIDNTIELTNDKWVLYDAELHGESNGIFVFVLILSSKKLLIV